MVGHFTKWCETIPLRSMDASSVAKTVYEVRVSRQGAPVQLHPDRGSNFESILFKELCKVLGILKTRTTIQHPEVNLHVERTNGNLKSIRYSEDRLTVGPNYKKCLLAYLCSVQTSAEFTPLLLQIDRDMRISTKSLTPTMCQDPLFTSDMAMKLQEVISSYHNMARIRLGVA